MSYATQSKLHIQCNLYQNAIDIFHRAGANNPKICMDQKRSRIARGMLKKKTKAGGITILDFKLSDKAAIIKTAWH